MYAEFAFFEFYVKFLFKNFFKYNFHMFFMFFQIIQKYQNIIDINHRKNVKIFAKRCVYVILKNDKFVREFEKHYTIFVMFLLRAKRNFSFFVFFYSNHVVNDDDVEFCKIFNFNYFIHDFVNEWQKIFVFDDNLIKVFIIHTKTQFFFNLKTTKIEIFANDLNETINFFFNFRRCIFLNFSVFSLINYKKNRKTNFFHWCQ